jgi:hypothetical protein
MDVLGWIWWLLTSLLWLVWSLAWFLLGGWVSTLAQVVVLVLVVMGFKYGWRRAPQELLSRAAGAMRFAWAWIRAKEPPPPAAPVPQRPGRIPSARRRQPGDIQVNISTLMSLLAMAGLGLLALL